MGRSEAQRADLALSPARAWRWKSRTRHRDDLLNKIIELDPRYQLAKAEIYHYGLHDYPKAIEQYNKVIKQTNDKEQAQIHDRARAAMAEIMEMLS